MWESMEWLIPALAGAIGVIISALVGLYNARIKAREQQTAEALQQKTAVANNAKALSEISVSLSQQAERQLKDCLEQMSAVNRETGTLRSEYVRYYVGVRSLKEQLENLLLAHCDNTNEETCLFRTRLNDRLKAMVEEMTELLREKQI